MSRGGGEDEHSARPSTHDNHRLVGGWKPQTRPVDRSVHGLGRACLHRTVARGMMHSQAGGQLLQTEETTRENPYLAPSPTVLDRAHERGNEMPGLESGDRRGNGQGLRKGGSLARVIGTMPKPQMVRRQVQRRWRVHGLQWLHADFDQWRPRDWSPPPHQWSAALART